LGGAGFAAKGIRGMQKAEAAPRGLWNRRNLFGHAFEKHGQGAKNTRSLTDTARPTPDEPNGIDQGQWLNNEIAARLLLESNDGQPTQTIDIPEGLGQVIKPNGSIVSTTRARIVRKPDGNIRTAYPLDE
jgi:hypothetical protein